MMRPLKRQIRTLFILTLVAATLAIAARYIRNHRQDGDPVAIPLDPKVLEEPGSFSERSTSGLGQVSLEIVREMVENRSAIVVDARLKSLFRKGHIPGAVSFSAIRPDNRILKRILEYPRHIPVVVYCASPNCDDSKSVAILLRKEGMNYVRIFPGGWQQWQAHGLKVAVSQ